jgi:hypothetical protein
VQGHHTYQNVGSYSITITLTHDSTPAVSVTSTAAVTAPTTTAVASSANPSVFGQAVTFTATVTPASPGTITGTVQFQVDGQNFGSPVKIVNGMATSPSISALAVTAGTAHAVTAIYSGDSNFLTSSGGTAQQVNALTAANLQAVIQQLQAANPGAAVTVTFQAANNSDAQSVITTANALAAQSPAVTIQLSLGSGNFSDFTANLAAGVALAIVGQPGTTTVTGGSPALMVRSGTVSASNVIFSTATQSPTVLVQSGSLTLQNDDIEESTGFLEPAISLTGGALNLQNNVLDVNGAGEFVHTAAGNAITAAGNVFEVNGAKQKDGSLSFTSLSSSAGETQVGQTVTFTATVTAIAGSSASPTGTVDFVDVTTGGDLGSAPLVKGSATLATSSLGVGTHTLLATYSGDGIFTLSLDSVTQTVKNNAPPVISSLAGAATVIPAEPDAFTAAFTDVVPQDSYAASFDWGDKTTSAGAVSQLNGAGTVSATHVYGATGAYMVTLTVSDTTAGTVSKAATFSVTVTHSFYLLSTGAKGALTVSGNGSINIPGVIDVDSNSSAALIASGNASIAAAQISVVGGVSISGNATLSPKASSGKVLLDPLAGLPVPANDKSKGAVNLSGNASSTIGPGVYSQIAVSGNASLTLTAGVYIIAGGGLSVTGNASLTGNGVVIYNAGSNFPNGGGNFGGIALSGNGSIKLSAPAGGTYAGVVIFQARDNTRALSLSGNGVLGLQGTIYAPAALLSLSGNAQTQAALVVNTLTVSGNGSSTLSADGANSADTSVGQLLGTALYLYVDNSTNGGFTSDENARIQDAVAGLDSLLADYGVAITLVSAADSGLANFIIDTAATTANGGLAQGVLGSTKMSGDITIVQGWDWYTAADAAGIQPGQYDFQTVVTHELGHALGLGHSADPGSVMYATLSPGQTKRTMTAADLAVPNLEQQVYAHPLLASPYAPMSPGHPPGCTCPLCNAASAQASLSPLGKMLENHLPWGKTLTQAAGHAPGCTCPLCTGASRSRNGIAPTLTPAAIDSVPVEFTAQHAALASSFDVTVLPGDAHERVRTLAVGSQDFPAELMMLAPGRAASAAALQHALHDLTTDQDHAAALLDLSGNPDALASLRDAFFADLEERVLGAAAKNRPGA